MADGSTGGGGSGSPEGSGDGTRSFTPAALRAGVKLAPGTALKITVQGVDGRPLPGGRKPKIVPRPSPAGAGTGAANPGGAAGGQSVGNSNSAGGGAAGADPNDEFIHVLAVEVRAIGDTLLKNHAVRVYHADTGEQVGEGTTDENGVLRMEVPKDNTYRIELIEEAAAGAGAALAGAEDEVFCRVVAKFVDAQNRPLAGEKVVVSEKAGSIERVTDENGVVDVAAKLQPYTLTVRGQKFMAHALPSRDHDQSANNASLFVVAGKAEAA